MTGNIVSFYKLCFRYKTDIFILIGDVCLISNNLNVCLIVNSVLSKVEKSASVIMSQLVQKLSLNKYLQPLPASPMLSEVWLI